jgi:hypothetical protein
MSPKHANALLQDISDVLGHDVYYIYPDSLHFIPPEIISGIAVGCLLEFLNGFLGFKDLGRTARREIIELLSRWRSSRDLEPLIQTLDLQKVASEALAMVPEDVNALQLNAGQAALKQALVEFGMDAGLADEHSQGIRKVIQRTITAGVGTHGQ